jgi:hypothetical protein
MNTASGEIKPSCGLRKSSGNTRLASQRSAHSAGAPDAFHFLVIFDKVGLLTFIRIEARQRMQ